MSSPAVPSGTARRAGRTAGTGPQFARPEVRLADARTAARRRNAGYPAPRPRPVCGAAAPGANAPRLQSAGRWTESAFTRVDIRTRRMEGLFPVCREGTGSGHGRARERRRWPAGRMPGRARPDEGTPQAWMAALIRRCAPLLPQAGQGLLRPARRRIVRCTIARCGIAHCGFARLPARMWEKAGRCDAPPARAGDRTAVPDVDTP